MKKTKKLTVSALSAAMCVAIMSIGSLISSLDVSLALIAGLVIMVIDVEYGYRSALAVYLAAGLLSFLLPEKSPGILFLALLGWYPIAQKKLNMIKPVFSLAAKFVLFNGILFMLLYLTAFVTGIRDAAWVNITLVVMGNICFYMYDFLLDRFFLFYLLKIRKRIKF